MLKIYKIAHDSKIYGPGIRDVIWFKGCSLHCKNCINQELWSTKGAKLFSVDEAVNQLKSKHLTLLGGEPLQQEDILPFIKAVKRKRIGVILFTGYEQSELSGDAKQAADLCDVVIYDRYIEKLKDDSLYLRGSLNQSIVFNTKKYKPKEFEKPNSYEVSITNDLELRGRTKELINDLLELNR